MRGVNAFVAYGAPAGFDGCVSCDARRCTPATSPVYGFGMPPRKKLADPALAVAYLRVSTDDQKLGPEIQRDQIGRWAAANGVAVLSWHFDEGEQAVVERARALRSQGVSYGRIVATLASEGVVARSGRPLIATQVVRMLSGKR